MAGTIADMLREIEEQAARLQRSVQELPEAYRDLRDSLVGEAYADLVETSPVDTGAYRAEHVIEQGEGEAGGPLLYESPSRVGPDAIVQRTEPGAVIEAPDTGAAKAGLGPAQPFDVIQIANRRFYAGFLEYGTSQMAPRAIYGRVTQASEARAERLDIPAARLGLE